jgi:Flp pilus assembly protein TadD
VTPQQKQTVIAAERALDAAMAHHQAGRFADAERLYRQVLAVRPDHPDALHLLGVLATKVGRADVAIDLISRAVARVPNQPGYQMSLAAAYSAVGRTGDAIDCIRRAVALSPDNPAFLYALGNELRLAGDLTGAETAYRRSVALQPNSGSAWNNLAGVLLATDDPAGAADAAARAISADPSHARAHSNLGSARQAVNDWAAAVSHFARAVELDPADAQSRWNWSLALLATGDFQRGWEAYESRWRVPNFPSPVRPFTQPVWCGEPLGGRTLLIHAEQGFGDTIQFARYVPMVTGRGGPVVFEVHPELNRLLQKTPGVTVVPRGDPLPAFDVHTPLMSLPRIVQTTVDTIPTSSAVLDVDPAAVRAWSARLDHARLNVGLVWGGQPTHVNDRNRSMPAAAFGALVTDRIRLISLQKNRTGPVDFPVDDWTGELTDFADTAAVIAALDHVVAVDTAVAHLAASLGKSTSILLPFSADYRWMTGRDDSPWYPTARLYRQAAAGDWESVVARVLTDLLQDGVPRASGRHGPAL